MKRQQAWPEKRERKAKKPLEEDPSGKKQNHERDKEFYFYVIKQQRFGIAIHESRWQDSQMRSTIQERTFEVAEENETVTVPIKTTAIAEIAEPLPPLTKQQRKDLETVHPNLKAQIERSMRQKNKREQQQQAPPTPAYKS